MRMRCIPSLVRLFALGSVAAKLDEIDAQICPQFTQQLRENRQSHRFEATSVKTLTTTIIARRPPQADVRDVTVSLTRQLVHSNRQLKVIKFGAKTLSSSRTRHETHVA